MIDVAFGAASNSHGTIALTLNMSITFVQPPKVNSLLIAEAREESRTNHTAIYHIEVLQKDGDGNRKIAICQAVVYRKDKNLPFWGGD